MDFGEKLKELVQYLQNAVFRHQDKVHGAVDSVGNVANKATKGKFEDKIAKAGEKAHAGVGKVASDPHGSTAATDAEGAGDEAAAAEGAGESAMGEAEGSADGHEGQPSESSAAAQEGADG